MNTGERCGGYRESELIETLWNVNRIIRGIRGRVGGN